MKWSLTVEEAGGGDGFEEYEADDFAQVAAGAEVLQGLEVRETVRRVEVLIPAGDGEDVLAEHTKFGVDEDVLSRLEPRTWTIAILLACQGRCW